MSNFQGVTKTRFFACPHNDLTTQSLDGEGILRFLVRRIIGRVSLLIAKFFRDVLNLCL